MHQVPATRTGWVAALSRARIAIVVAIFLTFLLLSATDLVRFISLLIQLS
jgi:hypothetical protein